MSGDVYGHNHGGLFGLALGQAAAIVRGTITAVGLEAEQRLYDVAPDWGAASFARCEVMGAAGDHDGFGVGSRVVLAVLGPNVAIVLGGLQSATPANREVSNDDPEPSAAPPATRGPRDRVWGANGAEVIFTEQGDVVIRPARAFRVEAPDAVRLAAFQDGSDGVVAVNAFVQFAAAVVAKQTEQEAWIKLASGTGTNPVYTPLSRVPDAPTNTTVGARGVYSPGAGSNGGE